MNDDLDRHEAAWLRGRLDDELAGLVARPDALQRVLDGGGRQPTRAAGRRDPGRRARPPVPPWLVVAAVVAAVAATLPLLRSAQQRHGSSSGAAATVPAARRTSAPPPSNASSSPAPTSAPPTSEQPSPSHPTGHSVPVTGPAGTGNAPPIPRCDSPSLVVSVTGPDGGAGTTFHTLVLTNTGPDTCYLKGYPGVAATGGAPTLDAQREAGVPASKVLLRPGQSAHALLAVQDVSSASGPCPSYAQLMVTPPDSRQTTTIPLQVHPCDGGLRVTAVQPGAG